MKNPPPDIDAHSSGVKARRRMGLRRHERAGTRRDGRTARDATGINADKRAPIDPRMPNLPPA